MITASHNPAEDNGVKLIDPKGEMLEAAWVKLASEFMNVPDESVVEWLQTTTDQLMPHHKDYLHESVKLVFIGQDTRDSSNRLAEAATAGVKALNGRFVDYGLLTTPQLHFIVSEFNQAPDSSPTEQTYYERLAGAFNALCQDESVRSPKKYKPHMIGVFKF